MGQFRLAGGLVLLSGGKLGPQIFLPLARGINVQDELSLDRVCSLFLTLG